MFLCKKENLIFRLSYEFHLKDYGKLYQIHSEPANRLTLVRVLNPCNLVPELFVPLDKSSGSNYFEKPELSPPSFSAQSASIAYA